MEVVGHVPCLNVHTAETLTCGILWSVAWRAYVAGYGGWWETWRCHTLRGASFALVWREKWGARASKARNILVIQVIVTIVFGKEKKQKIMRGCL